MVIQGGVEGEIKPNVAALYAEYSAESSCWNAAKTADIVAAQLAHSNSRLSAYRSTAEQVAAVLREWGRLWVDKHAMSSFLREPKALLHETEESIVALHVFRQWWKLQSSVTGSRTSLSSPSLVVVDACCGKGYFSMFLVYLVDLFWADEDDGTNRPTLSKVILFDKATHEDINWHHIDVANCSDDRHTRRPLLELWPGTNLHEYDTLLDKLLEEAHGESSMAMTGIHLCKDLTLSFCSLANGLGNRVGYVSVAPCCLPRRVTKRSGGNPTLTVFQSESACDRKRRREYTALRRRSRSCFLCQANDHLVRECPAFPTDEKERLLILQAAVARTPCWTCGMVGHFSSDCPTPSAKRPSATPPSRHVNAASVIVGPDPFAAYCRIVAEECLEMGKGILVESGLPKDVDSARADQQTHWNASRKSTYVIASASVH